MRFTLGKMVLATAALAVAAMVTTPAKASTVNVPFSFAAAGHVWPAGTYTVQKSMNGAAVAIKNNQSGLSFMSLLRPGEPGPYDTTVTLEFDRIGANHALRTVQFGPAITSRLDRKLVNTETIRASGR
jgi:hypothetical protein